MAECMDAVTLFKALGDESRLAILRILLDGESYVELIASRLALSSATVCHHLKKMEAAGLVQCHRTQFYQIYSVRREILGASLIQLIGTVPAPDDDTEYRSGVIENFFELGKLKNLPAQRKKRDIVLQYMLDQLPPKDSYTEKEINAHIGNYHPDYCTIRREMIACGLLRRSHASGEERYSKAAADGSDGTDISPM